MATTEEASEKPAKPKNPIAATGATVARNVARLRERRGLKYVELAARLEQVGRPIPTLGLRHIEAEKRRVDTDDLMALARVLDVSPIALLMPDQEGYTPETLVAATGFRNEVTTSDLWSWLRHEKHPFGDKQAYIAFFTSQPWWELYEVRTEPPRRANVQVEPGGEITWHGAGDEQARREEDDAT